MKIAISLDHSVPEQRLIAPKPKAIKANIRFKQRQD